MKKEDGRMKKPEHLHARRFEMVHSSFRILHFL